ncbi:hypothetical protein [Halobacteriovorax sp. HLS]|uniref:hypothetical protein n=1 Tax=Halobacteriovorax sp. HLS TaxID=2234000 RepID=UPI000FD768FE|nr:hypothetical protein [Halobacteriovorax sp. HLS]
MKYIILTLFLMYSCNSMSCEIETPSSTQLHIMLNEEIDCDLLLKNFTDASLRLEALADNQKQLQVLYMDKEVQVSIQIQQMDIYSQILIYSNKLL